MIREKALRAAGLLAVSTGLLGSCATQSSLPNASSTNAIPSPLTWSECFSAAPTELPANSTPPPAVVWAGSATAAATLFAGPSPSDGAQTDVWLCTKGVGDSESLSMLGSLSPASDDVLTQGLSTSDELVSATSGTAGPAVVRNEVLLKSGATVDAAVR